MRRSNYKQVRELLHYNPRTGIFTWRVARHGRPYGFIPAGTRAGSMWSTGYWVIRFNGQRVKASRLAFLWMTGEWPSYQVDHKNGIRSDDRWSNIRLATPHQNQGNRKVGSSNRLGIKGVCWIASRKKYRADISIDGRHVNLGRFNTVAEAQAAYATAAKKHFGKFARVV